MTEDDAGVAAMVSATLGAAAIRFCLEPGRLEQFEADLRMQAEVSGYPAPPDRLPETLVQAGSWLSWLALQVGTLIAEAEPDSDVAWVFREHDLREPPPGT